MTFRDFKQILEYLQGSLDTPPDNGFRLHPILWALFWAGLLVIILFFSGQSSKFIYIDF